MLRSTDMNVVCHAVPSCWKNSLKAAVGWLVGLCLLACEPGGKPTALQYSNAPKGSSEPVYRLACVSKKPPKSLN
ncbi:MAG: hypothetical protein ACOYNF_09185 [Rhodoferax sp.]